MVFRVDKNTNYITMSNYHLREKKMSLKAKGLLSWMLSNNDEWDYSIAGIVSNCKESETAIKSTLKELQEFGYLEIIKKNPDQQIPTIHYEYIIHEKAIIQEGDFQPLEDVAVENHGQISNIEISNKEKKKSNYNKYDPEQKKSGQSSQHSHTLIDTMVNQSPKISLYDKCINLIYSSTDSPAIRKSLIDFLNSISEQGKLKGFVQFKGILDKLFRLAGDDEDKTLLMIEYSIEKGYCTFYSINENQYNQRKKRGHASRDIEGLDPDKIVRATAEQKKQFKEDIANGKAERF